MSLSPVCLVASVLLFPFLFATLIVVPSPAQETAPIEVPPVFLELGFKEARTKADAEKKFMILDAMTSWCGPCKVMDKTTWRDAAVVAWIESNAIAIQLDMDRHSDVKTGVGIHAFPTIVMFKDGKEFDRIVGLRNAKDFLAWLEDAGSGVTALSRTKTELEKARATGGDWAERARLAGDLLAGGDLEEAAKEYLWVWNNAPAGDDAQRRKHQATAYPLREMTTKCPAVKTELARLRDALHDAVTTGAAGHAALSDWVELNSILAEDERSVAWANAEAARGDGSRLVRFEHRLFRLLIEKGAWKAAGLCLVDPGAAADRQGSQLGAYDARPSGKPAAGGMVPAIPMSKPRTAGKDAAGVEPVKGAEVPKEGLPMIPMTAPRAGGAPPAPDASAEGAAKPTSIPAIPMSRPRTAAKPEAPRADAARARVEPQDEIGATVRRRLTLEFRENAADRYAALLAAGRDDDALKVAEALLRHAGDRAARAALVTQALRAGVLDRAKARHQQWLDEAAWE